MIRIATALLFAILTTGAVEAASFNRPSGAGGRCGGIAGLRCEPGLSCRLENRRGSDRMGICVRADARPMPCPRIYRPVCGRDGRTYPNDCVMRSQGARLRRPGRC